MRIVQVTPRYPPHVGGVETHVREVSERLVDRGHDVLVLTADAGGGRPRSAIRNGVRVRRHRGVAPGGAFHVAPAISLAVRRAEADVVHAHNYHSLPMLFAALGRGDAPFVVTPHYHGASANAVRDALLSAYRPLGRIALERATALVAVSEWESERLRADFGVEAAVVPNGVDADRFAAATPERRSRPYLLCVGRLEAYKGVQHAIRALTELPTYDLVVVGRGPYADRLRDDVERAGVAGRVEFAGRVSDERLAELFRGAAVYVTLSAFESYGLTVGQALAAGTPCVVPNAGALAHWTEYDGCRATDSIDPASVAESVALAADSAVTELPPTWDAVVDRLVDVYDRAREERRRGEIG